MDRYRDIDLELFDLRQEEGRETLRVRLDSGAGRQRLGDATQVTLAPDLRRRADRLLGGTVERRELIALGREIGALLLPPVARSLFDRSLARLKETEGLRLRLRLDSYALADLPWELAYLDRPDTPEGQEGMNGFLSLDHRISIVRDESLQDAEPLRLPPVSSETFKLLVLLANPEDPLYPALDLEHEHALLREAVEAIPGVELDTLRNPTLTDIGGAVAEGAHLLHFAGHGDFARPVRAGNGAGEGRLVLAGPEGRAAPAGAEDIALAVQDRGLRLAVLSACEGARRDREVAWSGVAPALVREGIPAVVAMQAPVYDATAKAFTGALYRALAAGRPVDSAVSDGRLAMLQTAGDEPVWDWAVPVLYLRPGSGILFPKRRSRGLSRSTWLGLGLLVAVTVLAGWFYQRHLAPLFAGGLVVGGALGLAGAARLGWEVFRGIAGDQAQGWLTRVLAARATILALAAATFVVGALLGTTSSLYLSNELPPEAANMEAPEDSVVQVRWRTADGTPFGPQEELSVAPGETRGRPFFFRLKTAALTPEVISPPGLTTEAFDLAPGSTRRLYFPRRFKSKEMTLLRIIPGLQLHQDLPQRELESPAQRYDLHLRWIDSGEVAELGAEHEVTDLRQQPLILGLDETEMRRAAERESAEDAIRRLTGAFPALALLPQPVRDLILRRLGDEPRLRRLPQLPRRGEVLVELVRRDRSGGATGEAVCVARRRLSWDENSERPFLTLYLEKGCDDNV